MKTWGPVVVALLGFGTALVQAQHAAEVESRESEVVATLARVIEAHAGGCPC